MKIVILGPDGAGKSSVTRGLLGALNQGKSVVKMRYLKPQIVMTRRDESGAVNPNPHGMQPRSALTSIAKIIVWLMEEWYAHLFQDERDAVLICDRYYHDLLVDPIRYRYGGPHWMARLIGQLMPQPGLWVLLNVSADVLQARKQEVTREESERQRQAYLAFVSKQSEHLIVDAAQSLDCVVVEVVHAIAAVNRPKLLRGNR